MSNRVLVVEDEPNNRQLLLYALKNTPYEIHQAESGQEARQCMASLDFNLAIVDVELPDVSGLEIVAALRQQFSAMTIVVLTANYSSTILQDACKAGANVYVCKPFEIKRFMEFLKELPTQPSPAAEMLVLGDHLSNRFHNC